MMTDPRELLTLEQQELYDGVLNECQRDRETALAVLDRYDRLIEDQIRDMTAVRHALCPAGVGENLVRDREETR